MARHRDEHERKASNMHDIIRVDRTGTISVHSFRLIRTYILIITRVNYNRARRPLFVYHRIRLRAIGARSGAVHAKMELTAAIPCIVREMHTERERWYTHTHTRTRWHGREVKRALSQDRA